MHPRKMLQNLIEATQALGLEPHEQEELFPKFVVVTDELAQNFSDVFRLVDQIKEAKLITTDQVGALARIERILEGMSKQAHEEVWTLEGLYKSDEWRRVRLAARAALKILGAKLERPSMTGITYVVGGEKNT